ncbi:hypothetical protein WMY93_031456 [Mugilogobius chulae]|uniref:Rho-GAP domain-containing protein n=1 Tax=Mugilogobius chulae TaxID=88201 RepID=A0AAW0MFL0_9GOBI
MRYLFAFLNHLSQYSEENMMDPYNLAICNDQVSCQAHVNELIKTIIIHHRDIFPSAQDLQGPVYIAPGSGDHFCDSPHCEPPLVEEPAPDLQLNSDDGSLAVSDWDLFEATARFDYTGRTNQELSFKKGTTDGGRGSPKPDRDMKELLEERVATRGSAASPTGAHVADIYLANLNKMRKRPESTSVRRTFRGSDSDSPSAGVRTASLPVGGALVKDSPDKRPVSAHSILNSVTRHSSLKSKVESPQLRKSTPAGRSKSFSNHRPLDPEVIAQVQTSSKDIEAAMSTALSELRELERQSTSKHTPDVVLDTLEQLKGVGGGSGGASEPSSPLHSRLLRDEGPGSHHPHPLQRSASSASDVPSSFRPKSQPRSPLPSATSPPSPPPLCTGGTGSPAMGSPTSTVPPSASAPGGHSLSHTPPPPAPPQSNDKSCPA